jgi:hypothetical protein
MIVGLMLVSAASLWGLNALYEGYGQAQDEYQHLRYVNEIRSHLEMAEKFLRVAEPQTLEAKAGVLAAQNQLNLYASMAAEPGPHHTPGIRRSASSSTGRTMPARRILTRSRRSRSAPGSPSRWRNWTTTRHTSPTARSRKRGTSRRPSV